MTRLFLQLWIVAVLLSAGVLLALERTLSELWLKKEVADSNELLVPAYELGLEKLLAAPQSDWAVVVGELERRFGYPVVLGSAEGLPELIPETDGIGWTGFEDDRFVVTIPEESRVLIFGPITPAHPIALTPRLLALFVLSAGFALVLWLVLRRLGREHRELERAANQIAAGDLSSRADTDGFRHSTLATTFNRMAERTEKLVRSNKRLLQSVSHDLRTPIARLRIGAHLLAENADEAARREQLAGVDEDIQELDDYVDELLTHLRLDDGDAPEPRRALVDLANAVRGVVAGEQASDSVAIQLGPGLATDETTLAAEPRLLHRVLHNLISNALAHARTTVEVDASREPDGVRLVVDDDGSGIVPEDRERAFQPFVRLRSDEDRGYGLGLAVVRQILERHGGTAAITDSRLGGCRVETWWPGPGEVELVEGNGHE